MTPFKIKQTKKKKNKKKMADNERVGVRFSLAPRDDPAPAATGDLPHDEEALREAVFGSGPSRPTGRPPTGRPPTGRSPIGAPVTIFPAIRADYLADKRGAVRRSTAPYHNPDNLEQAFWDLPVDETLEWTEEKNERLTAMWDDPEFVFINLVMGATMDQTLGVRRGPTQVDPAMFLARDARGGSGGRGGGAGAAGGDLRSEGSALFGPQRDRERERDPPAVRGVAGPGTADLDGEDEGGHGGGSGSGAGRGSDADVDVFTGVGAEETTRRRIAILRNVRRSSEDPAVSGRLQMSNALLTTTNSALRELRKYNFAKFSGKTREHFYKSEEAMNFLVELVAALLGAHKIRANQGGYWQNRSTDDRQSEITKIKKQMNNELVFDTVVDGFILATPAQQVRNRRQRFRPPDERRDVYG